MDFKPEELSEGQKLFQTAMVFFRAIVEENLKDKTILAKKVELMNALEDKPIFGAEKKHIIVTSDPMEEFDDIVMIRFVLYNLKNAKVTVILSGGAHTPEERLNNVKSIFTEFNNAKMGIEMQGKHDGANITFISDYDDNMELNACDLFVNCGPTRIATLTKIVDAMKDRSKVVTVGANDDGTAGAGINQKFVSEERKLIKNEEKWNTTIKTLREKCTIQNLSVNVSRYVLFPNPKSDKMRETTYGKLADEPKFFDEAVGTTGMFIASRPPPKFGGRVNFGNSVVDYQLCKDLLEYAYDMFYDNNNYYKLPPSGDFEMAKQYLNGIENIVAYSRFSNTEFHTNNGPNNGSYGSEEGVDILDQPPAVLAAIPLMCTALMGGIRKKGVDGQPWNSTGQIPKQVDSLQGNGGYFFGSAPDDRDSKMEHSWVLGGVNGKFGDSVKKLDEFTPAYDPLAVLMGISMLAKMSGGRKRFRKSRKHTKKTKSKRGKRGKKRHTKKIKSRR